MPQLKMRRHLITLYGPLGTLYLIGTYTISRLKKKIKVGNTEKCIFQLRDAILIDLQLNMISGRLPPIPSQRSEKKLTKPVQKQPLEVP